MQTSDITFTIDNHLYNRDDRSFFFYFGRRVQKKKNTHTS